MNCLQKAKYRSAEMKMGSSRCKLLKLKVSTQYYAAKQDRVKILNFIAIAAVSATLFGLMHTI
nr:hypothetical protein [Candidatus Wolbachia massiliensis]